MDLWIIQNISPLFHRAVEMSLAACCIGVGVLILRKIPPFWKNALWLLVLVALVVPYRPSSNVAVLPRTVFEVEHIGQFTPSEPLDLEAPPTHLDTTQEGGQSRPIQWEFLLPSLWALGMVIMAGVFLVSHFRLRRKIFHGCNRPVPQQLQDLSARTRQAMSLRQDIELCIQDYLDSPGLFGLVRPKILLPGYVAELSEDNQRYILLHELCHLKHGDLLKNMLLLILQVVYWFNPLVWILFRFIRQDMEVGNDERVLKILGKSEEASYAMSLVEILSHSNKLPLAPQMLSMVDNRGNTKRRIQMIKLGRVFKRHPVVIGVACLAIIAVLGTLFLTTQPERLSGTYICTDAKSYGGFYPYATLELKQNGTYTFQFASDSSAMAQGKYSHTDSQLKLSFEDVELDRSYVFDVVDDGFSLDLNGCENAFFNNTEFPDGAMFRPNTTATTTVIGGADEPTEIEVTDDKETDDLQETEKLLLDESNKIHDQGEELRSLSQEELAYFNDGYFNSREEYQYNPANQFLCEEFATPADINLFWLFYDGLGVDYAMSEFDGEYDAVAKAYGFDSWEDVHLDVTSIPRSHMDNLLRFYTGTTLEESNQIGLDNFRYLEKFDCYYNLHGDTNVYGDVNFTSGTRQGDTICLTYFYPRYEVEYVLTLKVDDQENCLIYSNLPLAQ